MTCGCGIGSSRRLPIRPSTSSRLRPRALSGRRTTTTTAMSRSTICTTSRSKPWIPWPGARSRTRCRGCSTTTTRTSSRTTGRICTPPRRPRRRDNRHLLRILVGQTGATGPPSRAWFPTATCPSTTATIVSGGGPGGNLPPQIKGLDFVLSHSSFEVPGKTIQFNLTANDTEGDPLFVTWNFGDGSGAVNFTTNTRTDQTVSQRHAYASKGTYNLFVIVTDNKTGTLNHSPNVTAQIVIQTISTPGGSIPASSDPWINYGVPVAIVSAIVIAAVVVALRRRKERKRDETEDKMAGGRPPGPPPPPP